MSNEKVKIEAIIGKKYHVKSEISVGGMGKIYLGVHRSLNKHVAIKIIHQEFRKDETFRKRFYREARLAANLNHPGIVDIYDFGSSKNFDYIIMPFINGETLKEKLRREKRLSISESLNLIATITSALSFAHNNNVIHRDIKPSNILIDKQGHAFLTDFGISKDLGDVELTLPETVVGSPKYISPEQITGKQVDGRCDLYALGLVFYEMVTGKYPYSGRNTNAIYYAQVNEVPQRPDQIIPDIPAAVSDIIMKLVEKLPENRYKKGNEVLQDIANVKSNVKLAVKSGPKSAHPSIQSSEAETPVIDRDAKGNTRDSDGDLPTIVNIHRSDKNRFADNKPSFAELADSEAKSKSIRFSSWQFISTVSGFVLLVIIGYFLLGKTSNRTDTLAVLDSQKSMSDTLPKEHSSKAEQSFPDGSPPLKPRKEETKIKKTLSASQISALDSSEKSSPTVTLKQPPETVNLLSLTKQFKTLGQSQDAEFIRLWTKKNVYKIGDSIEYYFKTNRNCHLIVVLFSSSGEIIRVFPNRYYPESFISTGSTYDIPLPDSDINLEVTGPPGIEEILAIASDKPLEIFPPNANDQPFFVIDGTDPSLIKRIYENLQLAKKKDLKHKVVKYAITK